MIFCRPPKDVMFESCFDAMSEFVLVPCLSTMLIRCLISCPNMSDCDVWALYISYSGIFCSAYPGNWVEDVQLAPSCLHMRTSYTTIMIYDSTCVFSRLACNCANSAPAPGTGEHYVISQELAGWHKQRHPHGQPAEHAGTTASPWEMGILYYLPGAGNMAQKPPSACSAG